MLNKGADGINMVIKYQKYFETEVKLAIVLRRHRTRIR